LPEKKLYIDGRMPNWRYSGPKNESSYAFGDYFKMISDASFFGNQVNKYHITMLLLPKKIQQKQNVLSFHFSTKNFTEINKFGNEKILNKIKELGFKEAYKGEEAIVYFKSN
jgi:hypothetical protein